MRTIHKYRVELGANRLIMPKNADILTAQFQDGQIQIWAVVDDRAWTEQRYVYVLGTGHELPADMGRSEYVATVQGGPFVWHVFAHKAGVVLT